MIVVVAILVGILAESDGSGCPIHSTSCNVNIIKDSNAIIQSCFDTDIPDSTTVQIKCSPGYFLNSSSTITCRTGFLDDVQCILGCPPPGPRNNARHNSVKEFYNIGEEVSYTCNDGYVNWADYRVNNFNIFCQHDSTWSDENAECSVPSEFSISTINITSLTTNSVELLCDLDTVDVLWFRNGKEDFIKTSNKFRITSNWNLIVDVKQCDACGFYICSGIIHNRLQIAQKIYKLIGGGTGIECSNYYRFNVPPEKKFKHVESVEKKNVLLQCLQGCNDHTVTWYKDDEDLSNNKHRSVVPGTGLLLTNVTLSNAGKYICQVTYSKGNEVNTTITLSVSPSYETICGTTQFYAGRYTWYQPWLAVFYYSEKERLPFCYGTLLNNKWVVTTASCLEQLQQKNAIEDAIVQFGQVGNQQNFSVSKVKRHPLYRIQDGANDIGLVQLRPIRYYENIEFDGNIFPACVTSDDIGKIHRCEKIANLDGTVVGWGPWFNDNSRNIVTAEKMSVVPKEKCRNSAKGRFADDKFCAKFSGNEEYFVGDAGSPFLVYYHERNYLLGFYSWGKRASNTGDYDYFTSISHHYDWIMNITGSG